VLAEKKLTVGGTEQVGEFAWLCGAAMEQLKFNVPVKPELVTEKLPLALVPGATVIGLLLNEKACCGTRMAASFGSELEGELFASPG
jgi:hypothetical protein